MSIISRGTTIREFRERLKYVYWILFLSFFLILLRLWYLQLYKGDLFLEYSIENRVRSTIIPAPRGMIYDKEGRILVDNLPSFDITLTPQYIANDKLEETLEKVSKILELDKKVIQDKLIKAKNQPRFLPVVIKEDVTREELARVEVNKLRISGLDVKVVIRRTYMYGETAAHLLGHTGEISSKELERARTQYAYAYKQGDQIGKTGVELALEEQLRGIDGMQFFEVDAKGRRRKRTPENLFKKLSDVRIHPGNNVVLTIDLDLQKVAEVSFKDDAAGAAAAVDLRTGEMLVMASKPSFDPTLFSRGIAQDAYNSLLLNLRKPLMNKLIQGNYPPGSTFKVIVALAGLSEGLIIPDNTVRCPGWFRLGRRVYRCWRRYGHGNVNLHKAIVESCDTYFWWLGNRLGIEKIAQYARMLGLGQLTGIQFPEEQIGIVASPEWKEKVLKEPWIRGETISASIGQGYNLVTPMQLLKLYTIFANDGVVYKPYFVKRIEAPSGRILQVNEPKVEKTLMLPPEYFHIIKEGLFGVIHEKRGTARWTRILGIDLAGKTGTAQVIRMEKHPQKCEEQQYKFRDHALFVGFAPVDNPEIAAVAVVEHGCHGSSTAAPIVRNIIHEYYKKYKGLKVYSPTEKQKIVIKAEQRLISEKLKKQGEEDDKKNTD